MMKILFLCLFTSLLFTQNSGTTIVLLRHAEKVTDGSRNPALTKAGKERAKKLAFMLKDAAIGSIYSTDFIRTQKTVEVLAKKLNLTIKSYDPYKAKAMVDEIKKMNTGKTVLIVGHSNTLAKTIYDLSGKIIKEIDESIYSNLFILTIYPKEKNRDSSLIRLHF